MITLLLLPLLAQAGSAPATTPMPPIPPAPGTQAAPAKPMRDWAAMQAVPFRLPPVITPGMSAFVAGEVKGSHCTIAPPVAGYYTLSVDVALLIAADGTIKQAVPRAINCSTVEQFAAGLATSFASDNLLARADTEDRWFQTRLTFTWPA
ncbi:MAG: hypothetical protein ACTHMG_15395 [Sphingomonas sp.]